MKKILLFVVCLTFLPKANFGQILNPGFENWTNGEPDHWSTSNIAGSVTNISSNTDAHSGVMSARGEVVSFTGSPYPPLLSNTTSEVAGSGVDHRVVNLNMWIKFHSVGGDALYIVTGLTKSPNTPVGAISITIPNDVTEWSQLILPYKYIDPLNVPDTMNVAFTITGKPGPNANIGSWFEVDDIEYNDVPSTVGIQGAGVLNVSIFPNPVHESSTIHLSLAEHSVVSASIYDVAGRKLEELIEGSYDQGSYLIPFECAGFSSGMYYLRINASGKTTIVSLVVAN